MVLYSNLLTQKEIKAKRRDDRERKLAQKQNALPKQVFGVIYADPPWRFEVRSRETGLERAPENHYPTMTLDKIKKLKVPAALDSILFLWATVPMLTQALEVMSAWGFTYKTHYAWIKDRQGLGYWNRNQHELLLVGTRGNIPVPIRKEPTVKFARKGKHSAKPHEFRVMIEQMFPHLNKLEMFGRVAIPGWTVWGNEVQKTIWL